MDQRHRRALLWTLGIFVLLAVPITFRAILELRTKGASSNDLGSLGVFVYRDTQGRGITREYLYKSVTMVINIAPSCTQVTCPMEFSQIEAVRKWTEANLKIGYTEEKNPLHLFFAGDPSFLLPGWRTIVDPLVEGELIPNGYSSTQSLLIVVDPWLEFANVWDLSKELDLALLERFLSKTTFEQYLGNYLGRRTFMGPKKELKK